MKAYILLASKIVLASVNKLLEVVPETPTPASFQKSARGYWRVGDRRAPRAGLLCASCVFPQFPECEANSA